MEAKIEIDRLNDLLTLESQEAATNEQALTRLLSLERQAAATNEQTLHSQMEELRSELLETTSTLMRVRGDWELSRLEQSRLEQSRLEQSRLEQSRLEQSRLEQSRLEQSRLDDSRLEQSKHVDHSARRCELLEAALRGMEEQLREEMKCGAALQQELDEAKAANDDGPAAEGKMLQSRSSAGPGRADRTPEGASSGMPTATELAAVTGTIAEIRVFCSSDCGGRYGFVGEGVVCRRCDAAQGEECPGGSRCSRLFFHAACCCLRRLVIV
jgi:hypothetical protein